MDVVGIGRGRAQMIANARFCPFRDDADFKARFQAEDELGQWGVLEGLLSSGTLCVGGKQEKGGCLQINGASKWNLKKLDGVDEDLAAKIIDVRTCPYEDVDDMEQRLKQQPGGELEWQAVEALFHVEEFGLCLPGRDDNYATGAGEPPAAHVTTRDLGGDEEDAEAGSAEEAEEEHDAAGPEEQTGGAAEDSGAGEPASQPGAGDGEQDESEASAAAPEPEAPAAGPARGPLAAGPEPETAGAGPSPAPPALGAPAAAGASAGGEPGGGEKPDTETKPTKRNPPTHAEGPKLSGHRLPGRTVSPHKVPLRPAGTRVKPAQDSSGKPSWVTVTAKRCADGCHSAMDPYYRLVEVKEISAAVALMISAGHFCPFTSKADFETRFRAADKKGWTKVEGLLSSGQLCLSGDACPNVNDMTVYELSLVKGVDADLAADIMAAGTCPYEDEADMEKKVTAQKGGAREWPKIKKLIDDGCLCLKK